MFDRGRKNNVTMCAVERWRDEITGEGGQGVKGGG